MKQNLKEEIERNRELMGLPINEGTGVLDKLKDLFGLGYEKVMDFIKKDEEEIESEFGEIGNLKSDDVEKIAKYYEEEEGVDLDRDVSGNLKDFFKSEGIKYNDIDSGGDIDAEASIKFKAVLKSLVNEIPDLKIKKEFQISNSLFFYEYKLN
jgi:hypothetical protein